MILLLQYTLIFASVLVLVALGGCFSEHSGVINIGLEGIMVMGALGGALTMKYLPPDLNGALVILIVILACVVVGMLFSLLLGVAAIRFNADQTLVGTALNLLGPRRRRGYRPRHQHGRGHQQRLHHRGVWHGQKGLYHQHRQL